MVKHILHDISILNGQKFFLLSYIDKDMSHLQGGSVICSKK